jgi:hypothetical protein
MGSSLTQGRTGHKGKAAGRGWVRGHPGEGGAQLKNGRLRWKLS